MVSQQARLASHFELELLATLHGQCFCNAGDEAWELPAIATLLKSPGAFAYVVVAAEDTPAGLVIARSAGGETEILTLGILPVFRRQGLGSVLIDAVAAHAACNDADSVFLEVAADNRPAQALYRDAGFRPVGRRTGYYRRDSGPVDAIILRRDVRPSICAHPSANSDSA